MSLQRGQWCAGSCTCSVRDTAVPRLLQNHHAIGCCRTVSCQSLDGASPGRPMQAGTTSGSLRRALWTPSWQSTPQTVCHQFCWTLPTDDQRSHRPSALVGIQYHLLVLLDSFRLSLENTHFLVLSSPCIHLLDRCGAFNLVVESVSIAVSHLSVWPCPPADVSKPVNFQLGRCRQSPSLQQP